MPTKDALTSHSYMLDSRIAGLFISARFVEALVVLVALLVSGWLGDAPFNGLLWGLPLLILAVNLYFWRRVHLHRSVGAMELCCYLVFDCSVLWLLFWSVGGASNPFVSFLLVPIALSSVILPKRYAVAITLFCVLIYTSLLRHYLDVVAPGMSPNEFQNHVIGMWLNFIFAASLLCTCLLMLMAKLNRRDRELARQRETLLRDDAIIAVASLAANTAHTLNTPLGTIALVAESLADNPRLDIEAQQEVAVISAQTQYCGQQLQQIAAMASQESKEAMLLSNYAKTVMHHWRMRRGEITTKILGIAELPRLAVNDSPSLTQALLNLMDNAADATLQAGHCDISVDWQIQRQAGQDFLLMTLLDQGQPADTDALNHDPVATSKPQGMGLGLMLSRANIHRLGGSLCLRRRSTMTGTQTQVSVPLVALEAS